VGGYGSSPPSVKGPRSSANCLLPDGPVGLPQGADSPRMGMPCHHKRRVTRGAANRIPSRIPNCRDLRRSEPLSRHEMHPHRTELHAWATTHNPKNAGSSPARPRKAPLSVGGESVPRVARPHNEGVGGRAPTAARMRRRGSSKTGSPLLSLGRPSPRSSSRATIRWSSSSSSVLDLRAPAPRSRSRSQTCGPSGMEGSCSWKPSPNETRPSKPPGCGSSQKYRFGREAVVPLCMESGTPWRDTERAISPLAPPEQASLDGRSTERRPRSPEPSSRHEVDLAALQSRLADTRLSTTRVEEKGCVEGSSRTAPPARSGTAPFEAQGRSRAPHCQCGPSPGCRLRTRPGPPRCQLPWTSQHFGGS